MNSRSDFVQQTFGQTSLAQGAFLNQGFFQHCTFNTQGALSPEMFIQIQEMLRGILPRSDDSVNSDRIFISVSQLSFLGKSQKRVATGQEARYILGNITCLLRAISPPVGTSTSEPAQQNSRQEGLRTIDQILTASEHVSINTSHSHSIRSDALKGTEPISILRHAHSSHLPHCDVQIQTRRVEVGGHQGQDPKYEELTARIDIQPELEGDPERKPHISVYIKRSRDVRHPVVQQKLIGPLIIARRQIQSDSFVHKLISQGDLGGLQKLFKDGQASLWDCDEAGRSLITYAVAGCDVEICKYFIELGADIDAVEEALVFDDGKRRHLLGQVDYEDYVVYEDWQVGMIRRDRANKCRRLLLDAGSDPTIGGGFCAFLDILAQRFANFDDPELNAGTVLRLFLQHGSHFIDVNDRDSMGQTLLLQYCGQSASGPSQAGIEILLGLLSSVEARDNAGNTCLHFAVLSFPPTYYNAGVGFEEELEEVLVCLIQAGADPSIANASGQTPADIVDLSRLDVLKVIWSNALVRCDIPCGADYQPWDSSGSSVQTSEYESEGEEASENEDLSDTEQDYIGWDDSMDME
ncbi:ankyrin repeat-containing domain protein [Aspergillus karnatakaensis]|uniref:ankyrin repeat domain-containing protein n=1 Tax=Aspergillus karnatakaensis TaxID=1810916 RepID=UPI003CCDEF9F